MKLQDQINRCIAHLNEINEGVSRIEIRQRDNTAFVYSGKFPTVYFTIYSLYTDDQRMEMENISYEESIAEGEMVASEIEDSTICELSDKYADFN